MKKETVLNAVETTVDVITIGGLSMSGITAVFGIALLNPFMVVGAIAGGAVLGIVYSSTKDDFANMERKTLISNEISVEKEKVS